MSQKTTIEFKTNSSFSSVSDLSTDTSKLSYLKSYVLNNGNGADQAEVVFSDQRTITASSNEDLDLAGGLTDAFGQSIAFTEIKAMVISAADGNTNNVVVGGAGANGFIGPFSGTTDTLTIKPGGMCMVMDKTAGGYPVTAGTGDLLRVANSGAGTSVVYDIILIGSIT